VSYLRSIINNNIKTIIDDINGTNFLVSFGKSSIKGSVKGLTSPFNRNGDTREEEINGNINSIYNRQIILF
jgi:anionic cell wall polymer biosynthesis LytR-Cps2A-Psr (LCP) family protein